jgi:uncharacterized protein YdhG (YjbR/CyaY superfamily)
MLKTSQAAADIDAYIKEFPAEVRVILRKIRATVRQAAPKAEARISYRMPAFFQDGVIIYFAAFKKHIGVFPPVRDEKLRAAVAKYAGPKGNLQFPLAEAMPYALIARIVRARVRENVATRKATARR